MLKGLHNIEDMIVAFSLMTHANAPSVYREPLIVKLPHRNLEYLK